MALPIINQPTYSIYLHSLKREVNYRPYTTGEEKILIMAANSTDSKFVTQNIRKVISACISDPTINLSDVASYDIENLLIKIKAKSSGETIELIHTDAESVKHKFAVDLMALDVTFDPEHIYNVEITPEIGLTLKDLDFDRTMYYQGKVIEAAEAAKKKYKGDKSKVEEAVNEAQIEVTFDSLVDCVESIYDENEVYRVGVNTTREEIKKFIDESVGVSQHLVTFIRTVPTVEFKTTLPNGEEISIKGMKSFLG